MDNRELIKQIAQMLSDTAEAHHLAFSATDGVDPDWSLWYADQLREPLGKLLNATFIKSDLVYLLVLADKEQLMRAPGADWPTYYAKLLVERYL